MDLTDEQWEILEPLIPDPPRRADGRGRPWKDKRSVLGGVLWVLTAGAPWHDMPSRYPPYQTCHRRFQKWTQDENLRDILVALREHLRDVGGIDDIESFIDGTYVGAKKGGPASESRVRGTRQRSWRLQTALVFHYLPPSLKETVTTACSSRRLSRPRS